MWPSPWLLRSPRRTSRAAPRRRPVQPCLEELEGRLTPSPEISGISISPFPLPPSALDQTVNLSAWVQDSATHQPVTGGAVAFTVASLRLDVSGQVGPGGIAPASLLITGGTPSGDYQIEATYAGPSGTSLPYYTDLPIVNWPLIAVTVTPSTLPTASNSQQVLLGATVQDRSTGQPVTQGAISFVVFSGPNSEYPVLGRTGSIAVGTGGAVQMPLTIPAGTFPGTCMVLAEYTDSGGIYSNSESSGFLTITPASPVIPTPNTPVRLPVSLNWAGLVATLQSKNPTSPPASPTAVPTPSRPVAPISPPGAGLVRGITPLPPGVPLGSTGLGVTPSFAAPSGPFALTAYLPLLLPPVPPSLTQVVGGTASPSLTEAALLPTPAVPFQVPTVPLLSLGTAGEGTGSLGMGEEPAPLAEVTGTALSLGTALSDADDSAELFYDLARKGSGGSRADIAAGGPTAGSAEESAPAAVVPASGSQDKP